MSRALRCACRLTRLAVWAAAALSAVSAGAGNGRVEGDDDVQGAADVDPGPRLDWPRAWVPATQAQRDADREHETRDQAVWAGQDADRHLMLYRPALEASRGTFVLVFNREGSDRPQWTALRESLPRQGWHTVAVTLPDSVNLLPPLRDRSKTVLPAPDAESGPAPDVGAARGAPPGAGREAGGERPPPDTQAAEAEDPAEVNARRLDADRQRIRERLGAARRLAIERSPGLPVVVLGFGESGLWVADVVDGAGAAGIVLVDAPAGSAFAETRARLLADRSTATLIIQQQPLGWSPDDRRGDGVDLRLLPKPAGVELLLRYLKGWWRRRIEPVTAQAAPSAPASTSS